MSFDDAAQFYGINELRYRLPDVSEALLHELLSMVLKFLKDVSDDMMPVKSGSVH